MRPFIILQTHFLDKYTSIGYLQDHPLGHPWQSFMTILLLMIGDTRYDQIFEGMDPNDLLYIPAQLFYAAFIVLITIVFMNFLIGMSVSNVEVSTLSTIYYSHLRSLLFYFKIMKQKLENGAEIAQCEFQVARIHIMENQIFGSSSLLPFSIQNWLKWKCSALRDNQNKPGSG